MTSDRFPFLTRLDHAAVRHPEGWEVRSRGRHRIEYREGDTVALLSVEDVTHGVVLYAETLEWTPEPGSPSETGVPGIVARCALAVEAMGWGEVTVEWGVPRWGLTGRDEAFCFSSHCVVRIDRAVGVAEYDGTGGHVLVPMGRAILEDLGEGFPSVAWTIERDGRVPHQILDRVVEGVLFLTGDPVQVEQAG